MKIDSNTLDKLVEDFNLKKYRRDYDNKSFKTRQLFWHCALEYCYTTVLAAPVSNIDTILIAKSYKNGFYDEIGAFYDILSWFDNHPMTQVTQNDSEYLVTISYHLAQKAYNLFDLELSGIYRDYVSNFKSDTTDPKNLTFYKLDFVDHRHPHLPLYSKSLKLFCQHFNWPCYDNSIIIERYKIKRDRLDILDEYADNIIKTEILWGVMKRIYDSHKTGNDAFMSKIHVSGATEALADLKIFNKKWSDLTDKQLAYLLEKRYCSKSGQQFSKDSIRKAISRN